MNSSSISSSNSISCHTYHLHEPRRGVPHSPGIAGLPLEGVIRKGSLREELLSPSHDDHQHHHQAPPPPPPSSYYYYCYYYYYHYYHHSFLLLRLLLTTTTTTTTTTPSYYNNNNNNNNYYYYFYYSSLPSDTSPARSEGLCFNEPATAAPTAPPMRIMRGAPYTRGYLILEEEEEGKGVERVVVEEEEEEGKGITVMVVVVEEEEE